jgi:hypothetical protein
MSEIDRAILSALDTERIVRTVLSRMREFLPYDSFSVTLLDPKGQNPERTFMESEHRLKLVENIEKGKVFTKDNQVAWKCIKCGHIHIGNEAPKTCPCCKHPQAYFQEEARIY